MRNPTWGPRNRQRAMKPWTPTGNATTFASFSGHYFQDGKFVAAFFDVTWPATADVSEARIMGLPLTVAAAGEAQCGFLSFTDLGTPCTLFSWASATYCTPMTFAGSTFSNASVSGKRFVGAAVYYIT